ncbi:MAG: tyrosine-type recombinase/integrase [Candidatus Bathyarchaeota archaeon]|jgi:integrase
MTKSVPTCPECNATKTWKDGTRKSENGKIQRYICRECGYRFSETSFNRFNDSQRNESTHRMPLNTPFNYLLDCQIGVNQTKVAKNLVKVESQQKAAQRESNIKGHLISFAWHLKKMGRSDSTIKTYLDYLQIIARNANLLNPEEIQLVIANQLKSRNTKCLVCYAYDSFLKFLGIPWEKPQYKLEHKRVFIPTDNEINLAINCGRKTSYLFTLFIYETGARVNEAERLEWTDLDHERNKVTIKASKNGNSRVLTLSKYLMQQLLSLTRKEKTVFHKLTKKVRQTSFRRRLQKLARLHDNPRLTKIHYHTFRHCKALREYHKTKSMQHVKRVLGHKSIMTTQRYVELYEEIYNDLKPDGYICEIALCTNDAKKLVEQGFEYVCEIEGEQLFRKVK